MKKTKKIAALMLAAVMLVSATVAVTVAYLTSTTDVVNNTFTVGKVVITLDETKVDEYGENWVTEEEVSGETVVTPVQDKKDADRTMGNEYKLVPGHNYKKDPTIHVDEESENCWIFAEITVNVPEGVIADCSVNEGWTLVDENVYAWKEIVSAEDDIEVFDDFTVAGDANVEQVTKDHAITIKGYAVQADNFATAQIAWNATFGA